MSGDNKSLVHTNSMSRRPDEWLSLFAAVALLVIYAVFAPRKAVPRIVADHRDAPASLTTLGGTAIDPHPQMPVFNEFGCLDTSRGCIRPKFTIGEHAALEKR